MIKNFCLLIFFSFTVIGLRGQNLVPNPSFEDDAIIPSGPVPGMVYLHLMFCDHWFQYGCGTPDYFGSRYSDPSRLVPSNLVGFQYPRTGDKYAGFLSKTVNEHPDIIGDYREYLMCRLTSPLQIGESYELSMYISLADLTSNGQCASNNLGFLFMKDTIGNLYMDSMSMPLPSPRVSPVPNRSSYHETVVISDTANWTLIQSRFIADSAYEFLMIGNLFDNANTTFQSCIETLPYYYVDDVSVIKIEGYSEVDDTMHLSISDDQILPTVFTPNQDGKNDLFSFDASSFGDFTLTLYNRWGQVVHVMKKGGKFWDGNTISGKPCPEGCYYYSMSTDWDEHITGYITLFR